MYRETCGATLYSAAQQDGDVAIEPSGSVYLQLVESGTLIQLTDPLSVEFTVDSGEFQLLPRCSAEVTNPLTTPYQEKPVFGTVSVELYVPDEASTTWYLSSRYGEVHPGYSTYGYRPAEEVYEEVATPTGDDPLLNNSAPSLESDIRVLENVESRIRGQVTQEFFESHVADGMLETAVPIVDRPR